MGFGKISRFRENIEAPFPSKPIPRKNCEISIPSKLIP